MIKYLIYSSIKVLVVMSQTLQSEKNISYITGHVFLQELLREVS